MYVPYILNSWPCHLKVFFEILEYVYISQSYSTIFFVWVIHISTEIVPLAFSQNWKKKSS